MFDFAALHCIFFVIYKVFLIDGLRDLMFFLLNVFFIKTDYKPNTSVTEEGFDSNLCMGVKSDIECELSTLLDKFSSYKPVIIAGLNGIDLENCKFYIEKCCPIRINSKLPLSKRFYKILEELRKKFQRFVFGLDIKSKLDEHDLCADCLFDIAKLEKFIQALENKTMLQMHSMICKNLRIDFVIFDSTAKENSKDFALQTIKTRKMLFNRVFKDSNLSIRYAFTPVTHIFILFIEWLPMIFWVFRRKEELRYYHVFCDHDDFVDALAIINNISVLINKLVVCKTKNCRHIKKLKVYMKNLSALLNPIQDGFFVSLKNLYQECMRVMQYTSFTKIQRSNLALYAKLCILLVTFPLKNEKLAEKQLLLDLNYKILTNPRVFANNTIISDPFNSCYHIADCKKSGSKRNDVSLSNKRANSTETIGGTLKYMSERQVYISKVKVLQKSYRKYLKKQFDGNEYDLQNQNNYFDELLAYEPKEDVYANK